MLSYFWTEFQKIKLMLQMSTFFEEVQLTYSKLCNSGLRFFYEKDECNIFHHSIGGGTMMIIMIMKLIAKWTLVFHI